MTSKAGRFMPLPHEPFAPIGMKIGSFVFQNILFKSLATDERTDGRTDGQTDGRKDEQD